MTEFHVTILEPLELGDSLEVEPRRFDVMLADVVAIAERLELPTRPGISSVSPPRGRAADDVTILGVGFNPTPSRNIVRIIGQSCAIVSATETQLVVTPPFLMLFVTDTAVPLSVENLMMPGLEAWETYQSTADADTIADRTTENAEPGPFGSPSSEEEDPERPQAQDWNRLGSMLDLILGHEATNEPGDVLVADGSGLAVLGGANPDLGNAAPNGYQGQVLVADPAAALGVRFGLALDVSLPFGGSLAASAAALLVAGGSQAAAVGGANTTASAPTRGELNLVHLFCDRISGTDTIDRVRVLVGGAPVFDSGAGLGLGANAVYSQELAEAIAVGGEVELEATKLGATGTIQVVGGVRMELA